MHGVTVYKHNFCKQNSWLLPIKLTIRTTVPTLILSLSHSIKMMYQAFLFSFHMSQVKKKKNSFKHMVICIYSVKGCCSMPSTMNFRLWELHICIGPPNFMCSKIILTKKFASSGICSMKPSHIMFIIPNVTLTNIMNQTLQRYNINTTHLSQSHICFSYNVLQEFGSA